MERRAPSFGTAAATAGCLLFMAWVLSPRASAQGAGSAILRGTVMDASGGVLPGATLALTSVRTRATRDAATDAAGRYVFAALTPGPYRLRAELAGFSPWESSEIELSLGDVVHLDATLALAGQTEELTVVAEREMIRTDHGAREGLITSEQIQDLSVVSRSALELLRILPGTLSPDQSSMGAVGFAGGANDLSSYSINGGRGEAISPVLDGAKIVDFGSNTSLMLNVNTDMVDEVKVQTSNYAAEYGTSPYQVTALTKGGSASFHGSVYDYWRNWRFAANDRSNNYAGVPRPDSNYHYPGFNLSGPVLIAGTDFNEDRDTLFFFVGFELQRQTVDRGTRLSTVPTAAQRQGDFSELLADEGQNLGQPTSVNVPWGFPGAGQPAANNDLGPYIDPMGQAFLNLYPLPNHTDPDNLHNYAFTDLRPLDRWQLTTRLDWNVSDRTHAYVRLALDREQQKWDAGTWGGADQVPLPSRVVGDNEAWSVAVNVTSVLSPSLTNEIVVVASQPKLDNDWEDPSKVSKAALGLEGFQGLFPSDSPYAPMAIFPGGEPLASLYSQAGGSPIFAHNDSVSFADNLTKVVNAHTLRLGVFVERGHKQQNWNTSDGSIGLGSTWMPGGTGNDYGDLLVGRMAWFSQQTPVPVGEFRFWNFEGYVQDSWKVRRNLTLEAGLRLSKMPNNEELSGLAMRFEPSAYDPAQGVFIDGDPARPNGVLLASRGEIPNGITESPGLELMPRLNFAWDMGGDGHTILRGGAGLFYRRPPGNDQYYVIDQTPNAYNAGVNTFDVDGELTIPSLPTIDPWSRLGLSSIASRDPGSIHLPRTWSWSLGVAQRLPWDQILEVAYVGSRSDHLPNRTAADFIPPGTMTGPLGNADLDNPLHRVALDSAVAAGLRKYPAYDFVNWIQYEAWSEYDSLQATLSRSRGRINYLLAYTYSRTWGTNVSADGGGADGAWIDPIDPETRSVGFLDQNRPHILRASWSWVLPDPVRPDGNVVIRGLSNGWQLSGITSYTSGIRLGVRLFGELGTDGMQRAWWRTDAHGGGHLAPAFLGDPRLDNTDVGEKLVDIDQIAIPALGESGPFVPPYEIRTPARWSWDLTLMKNVPLGGDKRLQLRVGIFNLFNQAFVDPYRGDFDFDLQAECNVRADGVPNGAGGYVDGICDPSQGFRFSEYARENYGTIRSKHGHRIIELAARFDF
jgi:hypothetical protein